MIQSSPVFFWALSFLLGCGLALHLHWIYCFPIVLLSFLSKRKIQGFVFLAAGFAFALLRCPSTDFLEEKGIFCLESIQPTQSPFQRSLALKGHLKSLEAKEKWPCVIFQKRLPEKGCRWILEGKIKDGIFKPKKDVTWTEIDSPFSLARWRFENKNKIRNYFHHKIKDKRVGHFFASMATGDIDDRLLAMEFQKLGLGHILAISGFHFALIAAMIGWLLRLVFSPKIAYPILLVSLSLYFIFLGFSPSILRAFMMISLYVLGLILNRRIDTLNLLGAALLIELILDPLTIKQVGFQLSFLATLGILVFFRPFNHLLQSLLPMRSFSQVKKMHRIDQHAYLLSSAIRSGLALNCAVHLTTFPVVLYIFHSFPLLSLPYNLLLPPLLGVSLMMLPIGVLIPPIGILNIKYTSFLLKLIANPPEILNFKIFISAFPYGLLIIFVTIIGILGLTIRLKREKIV